MSVSKGGPIGNKYGWKGGETKCNGYVYVYCPNHPFRNAMGKGYVKRARLLIERSIGRYLERYEFVHHKNGIKDDDRLENLEVKSLSQHQSMHQKYTVKMMLRDELGKFKGGDANARKIFSNNHC